MNILDFLFKKSETDTCQHDWKIIDKYRGENGFGLIGYVTVRQCRKCGKLEKSVYYP